MMTKCYKNPFHDNKNNITSRVYEKLLKIYLDFPSDNIAKRSELTNQKMVKVK